MLFAFLRCGFNFLAASLLALACQAPAYAGELQMVNINSLHVPDPSAQVTGGSPAPPENWPATLIFRNTDGIGCTATVVGAHVVLTAAHCIKADDHVTINGETVGVECSHHPDYPKLRADFALCHVDKPFAKLPFENVNLEATAPVEKDTIVLLGYGCTDNKTKKKTFGLLFTGGAELMLQDDFFYFTKGGPALCSGDSGGGAYFGSDSKRILVGVNARAADNVYSYLAKTNTKLFLDWAHDWEAGYNAKGSPTQICGLNGEAMGCKN